MRFVLGVSSGESSEVLAGDFSRHRESVLVRRFFYIDLVDFL